MSAEGAGVTTASSASSEDLLERFCEVRTMTEALAAPLSAEDQTVQSMPDVSPTKWHRAHTTWFFETFVLSEAAQGYQPFDDRFGFLFNSYYDAVGERHPRAARGVVSRPGIAEIAAYRVHVDRAMAGMLGEGIEPAMAATIELGLHHEQQHQELLLMDIHHVLGSSIVAGAYGALPWASSGPGAARWRRVDGGVVEIGANGGSFSFDNELPRHEVLLQPYEISESLVTNGDVARFIEDGGYEEPSLWMSEGFAVARANGWWAPMSWRRTSDGIGEHTLDGLVELDPTRAASNLSWFEADAYARWAGARLPSEFEWEHAAPAPASTEAAGWYGEAWQWTASPYVAYPGFAPAPGAVGEYNGKFMVNQMVLRGSSLATPPGHARRSYRNFFAPSSRWAFSGLRLARDC